MHSLFQSLDFIMELLIVPTLSLSHVEAYTKETLLGRRHQGLMVIEHSDKSLLFEILEFVLVGCRLFLPTRCL